MHVDLQLFRRRRSFIATSILLLILLTLAYLHVVDKSNHASAGYVIAGPFKMQPIQKDLASSEMAFTKKAEEEAALLADFEIPSSFNSSSQIIKSAPVTMQEMRDSSNKYLDLAKKREEIRNMTRRAWNGYVKYAWGHSELRPKSKTFHDPEILGRPPLGATIVDAIDTLYIMGLKEEYEMAADWIRHELNFTNATAEISVFEVTIRFIGGLLSIYSMTEDKVFLDRAVSIVDSLLPAFDEATGLPASLLNLKTKRGRNHRWASNGCHILSEIGTLHMEFQFISELTGNPKYSQMVHRIRDYIVEASEDSDGRFFTHVSPGRKVFCNKRVTLSGEGDSFFEYLLKEWIRTNRTDTKSRELYDRALKSFERLQIFRTSYAGSLYTADFTGGTLGHNMNHLACFTGGMLALGAERKDESDIWFLRGKQLTETCRKSYAQTDTNLGPDNFVFTNTVDAMPVSLADKRYQLRPETVESYFYMWRFTHDNTYRQYAWDVVQALQKHCSFDDGFSGIDDVTSVNTLEDDVQQTYFIAETMKYLYLMFCDDSVLPLDRWVFNTEAHPLPIGRWRQIAS